MKRGSKLSREISISELLEMRKDMSVKEIADCLDVSVGTVYKYIGKKSIIADQAKQQNKPIPDIGIKPAAESKEEDKVCKSSDTNGAACGVTAEAPAAIRPVMKVLREQVVRDLQGSVCVFHIETGSNAIELKDEGESTVTGIISVDQIPLFIAELDHVYKSMKTAV